MRPGLCFLVGLAAPAGLALSAAAATADPRERILLDSDWRFQKGDPPGVDSKTLLYDVRPEFRNRGERAAEFTEAADKLGPATHPVLKPYILPSGNAFVKDPKSRYVRPEGNPGGDLAYVQANFDDSGWTRVRLPHDWAIEGPGEIVATDNGDPTSFELFQSHERNAFNGYALVIVRGKAGQAGTVRVSAASGSLRGATVEIKSVK